MKISIIIPIYNVERYVGECLDSVLSQSYGDLEIIVVDDCSTDGSMAIVESYDDQRIQIIRHEVNRGLSAARNSAMRVASGEYLYFLDSDDMLAPNTIATMAELASRYDADMVVGRFRCFGAVRAGVEFGCEDVGEFVEGRDAIVPLALDRPVIYVMAWGKLVRRSLLVDNELYFCEGRLHEDNLWSFFVAHHIERVAFSSEEGYLYRLREDSITGTYGLRNLESITLNSEDFLSYASEHRESPYASYYALMSVYILMQEALKSGFWDELDFAPLYKYRGLALRYGLSHGSFGRRVLPLLLPKWASRWWVERRKKR